MSMPGFFSKIANWSPFKRTEPSEESPPRGREEEKEVVIQNDLYWTHRDLTETMATSQGTATDPSVRSRPPMPTRAPPVPGRLPLAPAAAKSIGGAQVSIAPGRGGAVPAGDRGTRAALQQEPEMTRQPGESRGVVWHPAAADG